MNITGNLLTVRLQTSDAIEFVLADSILIDRLGDLVIGSLQRDSGAGNGNVDAGPASEVEAGGQEIALRQETGAQLESPIAPSEDAILATTYWSDELDDVVTLLAEDQATASLYEATLELPSSGESDADDVLNVVIDDWAV